MRKSLPPLPPDEKSYIFSEGINYFELERESIWGREDPNTLRLIEWAKMSGQWVNLAAGDGRYNSKLLDRCDMVICFDIDGGALGKLRHLTPPKDQSRLVTVVSDITKPLPLKDNSVNGVFCAGTLHYFPWHVLKLIYFEITRILKIEGEFIFDFATDIKRISLDGDLYFRPNEARHTFEEAKRMLPSLLTNYRLRIFDQQVPQREILMQGKKYRFSCNGIFVFATKNFS